jgi:hypothetical protein
MGESFFFKKYRLTAEQLTSRNVATGGGGAPSPGALPAARAHSVDEGAAGVDPNALEPGCWGLAPALAHWSRAVAKEDLDDQATEGRLPSHGPCVAGVWARAQGLRPRNFNAPHEGNPCLVWRPARPNRCQILLSTLSRKHAHTDAGCSFRANAYASHTLTSRIQRSKVSERLRVIEGQENHRYPARWFHPRQLCFCSRCRQKIIDELAHRLALQMRNRHSASCWHSSRGLLRISILSHQIPDSVCLPACAA